ncbi:MAG: YHYH protein [Bacteroidia bacterium]|nr:YHYH protein [Bacteroidia bacterium]
MKKLLLSGVTMLISINSFAQGPEVTSWIINTTAATGYAGIPSNVQQVQYSTANVYVSCTGIPSYNIGPWPGNPNVASNQNYVFKITRNPQQNMGTPTAVGLGHIGLWSNGVSIYNVSDGQSYLGQGIWNRNAYFWEGSGFDNCLGHPQMQGEYHHHVSPKCLYDETDSTHHSPIIGYAFDGFPVYGAYAYTNTNGTGPIKRMVTSYSVTIATTRTNGPSVNSTYPAGCYIEDHIYSAGSGDLDARNGRFCITPEYPLGTYAYFVSLDASLTPVFPYTFFGTYYGIVQPGNTGPGSGHNVVTESVTTYSPAGMGEIENEIQYSVYPNPAKDFIALFLSPSAINNSVVSLVNSLGQKIFEQDLIQPAVTYYIDLSKIEAGIYFLNVMNGTMSTSEKVFVVK